ncbi:DNA-directed RNA polymerase subunit alpha C-terminal domain-containing protein [Acinetobacter indicus]|uniref:RNA polymerase alpha subunit C-terminal domain-containing protein n=3 Tax=Acinetobacter TaxID=469 RepID=A0A6C0Y6Z3_9GAMM|nr:DNA-directed RNA polymerase subunit alpha C-terminal domain-containing protein [Acinetobacter indicus]QIC71870.1 hypothetical protein FSC09_15890 [Acinetobacter indicus]
MSCKESVDSKQLMSSLSEEEHLILRIEIEKMAAQTLAANAKAKRNQVQVKKTPPVSVGKTDRNIEVMRSYLNNNTMAEIATCYDISTTRIRQIIQRMYTAFISYLKWNQEHIKIGDLDKKRITEDLKGKFNNFLDNYRQNVEEIEKHQTKFVVWETAKKLSDEPVMQGDIAIADAYLTARTIRILEHFGYKTMNQVANLTQKELLQLPGLGKKSLKELQEYFATTKAQTA